jgi:hypothetical protein
MKTIIVVGPQGCGKTRNGEALQAWFGCTHLVDGWAWDKPLVHHALHLTSEQAPGERVFRDDRGLWFMQGDGPKARVLYYRTAVAESGIVPETGAISAERRTTVNPAMAAPYGVSTASAGDPFEAFYLAACDPPLVGTVWLHVKSGEYYSVTGECMDERTWSKGVLYSRTDGTSKLPISRVKSEFLDGRFRRVYVLQN